jgi:NitT/TauT family transport system substrate-binding protein
MKKIVVALCIVLCFKVSFAASDESVLKKLSFVPQWVPQAQFAGYYVAYEKGIYKKYGIDLTIIPGGPDRSPLDFLESGKADFATMWLSTAIQARARGVELVNIGQIIQRSALMLIAKKAGGINLPSDLDGKKVGLWGADFQVQPRAFFKKYNLEVEIIPQSQSINLFLRDGVDVASAMWYNEYHTVLNSGLNPDELTTFFFHEHGLNFPEDGIYTLVDTFKEDPGLSCAFVNASIEGWKYAFSHPEEALDIIMKYIRESNIPANRVHQRWMLERMKDLILPQDSNVAIGTLLKADYERVAAELKESDLINEIPDYKSFYIKCNSQDET